MIEPKKKKKEQEKKKRRKKNLVAFTFFFLFLCSSFSFALLYTVDRFSALDHLPPLCSSPFEEPDFQ